MTNPGTKPKKTRNSQTCPACRTLNRGDSRFCANCAAPLKAGGTAAPDGSHTIRATTVEIARGNRIAGRYEIIEELGQGGMGRVFRVFDHQVSEIVALKLIRPEIGVQDKAIERFKNELKFTRKITHRNICRMYDLGEVDLLHYITMEYVAGEDLKRFIKRAGPLNTGKAISIAKQVCAGLAEAHRVGAVHRDLKPQNIMIDPEGVPKIMDFGIARFADMDRMTGSGVMIGTPEYMSPEQAELKEVDKRADIYALGCVLFEMVTGRVPFEGETALGLAMKHKMEKPRDVRDLNPQVIPAIADVVAKCLEKEPARRYQDADELLVALTAVETNLATGERVVPPDYPRTPAPGTGASAPRPTPAAPASGTGGAPAAASTRTGEARPVTTPQPQPAAPSPTQTSAIPNEAGLDPQAGTGTRTRAIGAAEDGEADPQAKPGALTRDLNSRLSAAEKDPQSKPGAPAAALTTAPGTGKGKKPVILSAAVVFVVVAAVLLLSLGKKSAPAADPAGPESAAVTEPAPAVAETTEAREAGQAKDRMMAVKNKASQAGLDSGVPVIRAALTLEKEANELAGDKAFTDAALAFAVAERIYRVSVDLSSDDLRLEGLKAFVAEARAGADPAINANPENKLLLQALLSSGKGKRRRSRRTSKARRWPMAGPPWLISESNPHSARPGNSGRPILPGWGDAGRTGKPEGRGRGRQCAHEKVPSFPRIRLRPLRRPEPGIDLPSRSSPHGSCPRRSRRSALQHVGHERQHAQGGERVPGFLGRKRLLSAPGHEALRRHPDRPFGDGLARRPGDGPARPDL